MWVVYLAYDPLSRRFSNYPLNRNAQAIKGPKLTVLSVAPLFGEAIRRINKETSVSSLLR